MRESTHGLHQPLLVKSPALGEQGHPDHEFGGETQFPSKIHFAAASLGDDPFV
jgi:hypothetical protein